MYTYIHMHTNIHRSFSYLLSSRLAGRGGAGVGGLGPPAGRAAAGGARPAGGRRPADWTADRKMSCVYMYVYIYIYFFFRISCMS